MGFNITSGLGALEGWLPSLMLGLDGDFLKRLYATVGVIVALYVFKNLVRRYLLNPFRHLPKTRDTWTMLHAILDSPRGSRELTWMKTIPNEGLIHIQDVFGYDYLLVTNHTALQDVLCTKVYDFAKPRHLRAAFNRILGPSLLSYEGGRHKKERKTISPAFLPKGIREKSPHIWAKTLQLIREIDQRIDRSSCGNLEVELDVDELATRFALDAIGLVSIDHDFQTVQHPEHRLAQSLLDITEFTYERMLLFAANTLLPSWVATRLPWKASAQFMSSAHFLSEFSSSILHEKRSSFPSSNSPSILGSLIGKTEIPDIELASLMRLLLLAGQDTTAGAITWVCYLLCRHPEYQDRLRSEVRANVVSSSSGFQWSVLEAMPWLNAFYMETMRLYPAAPWTVRESICGTSIAGHVVPKGTTVILCPYAINRSPELWGANAEEFYPERWLIRKEDGSLVINLSGGASSSFAYLTFLKGPRSCIGKHIAQIGTLCAVAAIVGRFEMKLSGDSNVNFGGLVSLRASGGLKVKMRRVEGW